MFTTYDSLMSAAWLRRAHLDIVQGDGVLVSKAGKIVQMPSVITIVVPDVYCAAWPNAELLSHRNLFHEYLGPSVPKWHANLRRMHFFVYRLCNVPGNSSRANYTGLAIESDYVEQRQGTALDPHSMLARCLAKQASEEFSLEQRIAAGRLYPSPGTLTHPTQYAYSGCALPGK